MQCLYWNYSKEKINEIIKLVKDGAKYALSIWLTEVKDIDLVNIILKTNNKDKAM